MVSHKEAQQLLDKTKEECKEKLPVIIYLSEIKMISNSSMSLIRNRISIDKYHDRYALKRNFYKPITIQHPINE
ncbi:hypothetical protein P8625_11715 [Tenacibaculum tangerinum]|uniref:Uncharacterized protein n=1 Tax=Tenacibaculum tangerinum TaxID=3038772 RepID=A0ABY8L0X7_9FLAO|nr:hypothetical protein [Tenacibaculum tangerinum]WGH74746.1 hypothetical protein P8625_11715 [Tenacibaculum tangerinum]